MPPDPSEEGGDTMLSPPCPDSPSLASPLSLEVEVQQEGFTPKLPHGSSMIIMTALVREFLVSAAECLHGRHPKLSAWFEECSRDQCVALGVLRRAHEEMVGSGKDHDFVALLDGVGVFNTNRIQVAFISTQFIINLVKMPEAFLPLFLQRWQHLKRSSASSLCDTTLLGMHLHHIMPCTTPNVLCFRGFMPNSYLELRYRG